MSSKGYSYIEVIISMSLISIFGLCFMSGFSVAIQNYRFAKENYYANVASENLLNAAEAQIDKNDSISNILLLGNDYFYTDKFNFVVRLNEIGNNFEIDQNSCDEINFTDETYLPIKTEISCDNPNLFKDIAESKKANYLITVDVFDKNHKFLKRLSKIY